MRKKLHPAWCAPLLLAVLAAAPASREKSKGGDMEKLPPGILLVRVTAEEVAKEFARSARDARNARGSGEIWVWNRPRVSPVRSPHSPSWRSWRSWRCPPFSITSTFRRLSRWCRSRCSPTSAFLAA